MKKKALTLLVYAAVLALIFYLLPFLFRDTGSVMVILLAVMPMLVFACAVVYGVLNGFDLFPFLLAVILFVPTLFLYYNESAWVYALVYGIITLVGNAIGRIFYKKPKKN